MNTILYLFWLFLNVSACKSKATNENGINKTTENNSKSVNTTDTVKKDNSVKGNYQQDDTLYNIISRLKEVKTLVEKTNSKSSNQKVNIIINKKPDKEFLYYWLQAGVDDGSRFQPVYNFYISPKSFEIHYYNTANDSIITLSKWREKRGW